MKYAIEVKNLQKKYGEKTAVCNLSFCVGEGKLFSLLGVNGAGKTTMIKMLTGLAKPTSGEAFLYGKEIGKEQKEIKRIANLSTQETAVAPNLTVRENLEFVAGIYGMNKRARKEAAQKMIERFSMQEEENSRAKTLSGGWQRKLSIAMALITDPKILFLDEPTLGLDVLARRELWRMIGDLKGRVTIVLTTHYMEEAEALSDEIAVMVKGNLAACGTLEELKDKTGKPNLEEAFIALVEGGRS